MLRILISLVITLASASPVDWSLKNFGDSPLYHKNLFEGDIAGVDPHGDRNAIVDDTLLWPGGVVYYELGSSVESIRDYILDGIRDYHEKTCLKFKERTPDVKDYVRIEWYDGCWSMVGRQGGKQELSLGSGCHWRGLVVHELGHAIGFWHEQNRADRDDYIEIFWDNIIEGLEYAFDKLQPWENNYLNEEFDYESVMLYGETAFSKDGVSQTVKPKKPGVVIGLVWKKPGLSASDIRRVNRLYECFGEVRPPPPEIPDFLCDFENNDCGVENQEKMRGEFVRTYGTLGDRTGYFMKLKGIEDEMYPAGRLITPTFGVYGRERACLTIDLYMVGLGVESFDVYRQDRETEKIYETNGNSKGWTTLQFDLVTRKDIRFFLTGNVNKNNGEGDIAIDNIRFSRRPC
ncbi:astacin-like metalloprotease toxin 1 [Limulus polyphemus]|uniref:Metalloendopeptidase n=1 Tax=Limulus polyphemus TaxID=6850 RepID=A0ABM1SCH1_LIMPO|nr:astacin-like metalloprotease toxin 1 [Limulus polyphemus]